MFFFTLLACTSTDGILERSPLAHEAWADGFQVVPPVALPRPTANGDVEVWVELPGAGLHERSDGARVLHYAPGTRADRVEFRTTRTGRRVVDVRGTTLDAAGQRWHHVYQPVSTDPDAALLGVEWPAGDPELAELAIDRFIAALDAHGRKNLDSVRAKLDCESCHLRDRPDNQRPGEHGLVARGTDGAGFFTPSTLLADEAPAESYGIHAGPAPFTTWTCAGVEVPADTRRCADGSVARIRVDAAAAALATDARWAAVETSREHLDAVLENRP